MTRAIALLALLATACAPLRPGPSSVALLAFYGTTPRAICRAFPVRGEPLRLLTAAHCLRGAQPGADVAYSTRSQWERTAAAFSWARVVRVNKGADWAELAPDEADALAGFEPSRAVPDSIRAEAPGWIYAPGVVREQVGALYRSTLDVHLGWSGSPVLDGRGRVVGIVIACEAIEGACLPHAGVFAGLPP